MSQKNMKEYVLAGGGAAIISRTAIAPVERVKIIFQTSPKSTGYLGLFGQIFRNEGFLSFWKGNSVAVARVVPYLCVQLSSNEVYREHVGRAVSSVHLRNLFAGILAGATSIVSTYPLDTVRARLAVQMTKGESRDSIAGMTRKIYAGEGVPAFYRGCYMSCFGGGTYSGIKFMTYDILKDFWCRTTGVADERDLNVLQRAASGAAGGFVAQTFVYPMDVIRRRMQTTSGPPPYTGIVNGVTTIARTEGIRTGLFRGLSLNFMKTLPNVAIYLSLYDVFKYWLMEYC